MAATWRMPTSKLSSTATLSRFTSCPGTCWNCNGHKDRFSAIRIAQKAFTWRQQTWQRVWTHPSILDCSQQGVTSPILHVSLHCRLYRLMLTPSICYCTCSSVASPAFRCSGFVLMHAASMEHSCPISMSPRRPATLPQYAYPSHQPLTRAHNSIGCRLCKLPHGDFNLPEPASPLPEAASGSPAPSLGLSLGLACSDDIADRALPPDGVKHSRADTGQTSSHGVVELSLSMAKDQDDASFEALFTNERYFIFLRRVAGRFCDSKTLVRLPKPCSAIQL